MRILAVISHRDNSGGNGRRCPVIEQSLRIKREAGEKQEVGEVIAVLLEERVSPREQEQLLEMGVDQVLCLPLPDRAGPVLSEQTGKETAALLAAQVKARTEPQTGKIDLVLTNQAKPSPLRQAPAGSSVAAAQRSEGKYGRTNGLKHSGNTSEAGVRRALA